MIQQEAERSIRIVQNLLQFARPGEEYNSSVSVNEAVTKALDLRRHQLQLENITLIEDLDPRLPPVQGNDHELQQVFLNLVVNAEQTMTKANGGGRLLVKTEDLGHQIRIIVSDNGPGIAPENLERLFDFFFTTKEVGEGTGLGLSICYGIVERHSGRIWAESDPPNGATFFVELPTSGPRAATESGTEV